MTVKEKCETSPELFEMPIEKFQSQHNETILSMKYCKLVRENRKSAEEWLKAIIKKDRRFKEHFINGIDDMITEIIRELTVIKKTIEIRSEKIAHLGHKNQSTKSPKSHTRYNKRKQRSQYDKESRST